MQRIAEAYCGNLLLKLTAVLRPIAEAYCATQKEKNCVEKLRVQKIVCTSTVLVLVQGTESTYL